MVNFFRWTGLAVSSLLVIAGSGCSTGPTPLTPAQVARHIDSLLVATKNQARWIVVDVAEYGPAYGVSPATVVVTTRSGPHNWHGYMWRYVLPLISTPDSVHAFVAWSDNSLTDVLWAEEVFPPDSQPIISVSLVTNDTVSVTDSAATLTAALASTGGDCVLASGLTTYTEPPQAGRCALATFTGSFAGTFPAATAEFQTVSIASQSFVGIWSK
ncbi:MAG TPA: hypothetical protein VK679_14265 [Gemmatimonadaceae bacterium]|jgi:hypothetical protein|nr:hypothetical protein [Gemmatimonadaceae bacterium]